MLKPCIAIVSMILFCCSQNFSDSGVKETLIESNMKAFKPSDVVDQTTDRLSIENETSTEVDLGGLIGVVPKEWDAVTPSNSMRIAEYHLHGYGGDEEGIITVFYFGPGQGGDTQANINRWIGQFQSESQPPISRQWSQRVSGMNVERLEVSGTYYVGTMSGGTGESIDNYLLYAAIVESPNGSFFFKMTGQEAILEKHKESFERYISTLRSR